MLLLDKQKISAEDLMKKFSTLEEYNKIVKRPSFEITDKRKKIDRANGGRIKVPMGGAVRTHFFATDPKTRTKVEIRYAEGANQRVVGDRVIETFEPRYVSFMGQTKEFRSDLDLAVFWFLHPNNALSPIADPKNKNIRKIQFIDTKKRAQDKISKIDALGQAMEHSRNLDEKSLIILAKGMGMKGIERKEPEEIRADVMEYASLHPVEYNTKAATQLTYIEGKIRHLVDRKVFKLETIGTVRRWSWAKGKHEGEFILDINNTAQDAIKSLLNFFLDDINAYKNTLDSIADDITVREKAERALKVAEEQESLEENTIGDKLPDYLKSEEDQPKRYTREEVIDMLTGEDGTKPHHLKVTSELRKLNGE